MDEKVKIKLIVGASVGWSLTVAAAAYGASWLKNNIQTNHLPKGGNPPFLNSCFYERGDYRIHYRIDESKRSETKGKIFMVHGFGCSTVFFDEMVELLTKAGYMCVRADVPNFGYSTRENENIRPIDREELLFGVINDVAPNDKWILMGHSMGGGIALNMALLYPERFSALAMYGPMLAVCIPKFLGGLVTAKPLTKAFDVIIKYGGGFDPLMRLVLLIATRDKKYMDRFKITLVTDPLRMEGMGTGLCYMTKNAKQKKHAVLQNIRIPIYLVWGEKDVMMTKKASQKLEKSLPRPEVVFMDGGGHCMIQNRADEVVGGTLAFFEKHAV